MDALPPDDCPGPGRCHGCQVWCDRCGDVAATCDAELCHRHRCVGCKALLTPAEHAFAAGVDWYRWCFTCWVQASMKLAISQNRDELTAAVAAEAEIAPFRAMMDAEAARALQIKDHR